MSDGQVADEIRKTRNLALIVFLIVVAGPPLLAGMFWLFVLIALTI